MKALRVSSAAVMKELGDRGMVARGRALDSEESLFVRGTRRVVKLASACWQRSVHSCVRSLSKRVDAVSLAKV